jgi:hypothetical protein
VSRSKNAWSYTSTPPTSLHGIGAQLKAQGQLLPFIASYKIFKHTNDHHQAKLTSLCNKNDGHETEMVVREYRTMTEQAASIQASV